MIKLLLLAFGGFLVVSVVLIFVGSLVLNSRFDNRPEAREFTAGTFPTSALQGKYKGNKFTGLGDDWLGKNFNASENKGINNFNSVKPGEINQRYPFATSKKTGLRNKNIEVLQLNYNQPSNPLWLKFVRDELVQTAPGEYLGKIHLKLGPFVITLGYFHLSAN